MSKRHKHDALWAEAKRRCRLSAEDVRKAREMGLNPRKLMGNMPSPSQQWKAPVHIWVRELYRKRQEKMAARAKRRAAEAATATGTPAEPPPDRAELKYEAFDDSEIGVAHHQVDIHLFAPVTDRYLGRLCLYGTCPKGKPECRVPGCGQSLFLQVIADYVFDAAALAKRRAVTLFDRAAGIGPPASEPNDVPF